MDKQRLQIIITSSLVIVFIFAWVNAAKVMQRRSKPKPKLQPRSFHNAGVDSILSKPKEKYLPSADNSKEDQGLKWLCCPFSGKIYSGRGQIDNLRLNGILWDEDDSRVIINKKILRQRDKIGTYTIINIEKNKVTLSDGLKDFELKMGR